VEKAVRVHPEQRMMQLTSGAGTSDKPLLVGMTEKIVTMWSTVAARIKVDQTVRPQRPRLHQARKARSVVLLIYKLCI